MTYRCRICGKILRDKKERSSGIHWNCMLKSKTPEELIEFLRKTWGEPE